MKNAPKTRQRLIDVAGHLFETEGYDQVSSDRIVRDSDLTRGALYHHFGGKEGLFEVVVEDRMADLHAQLLQAVPTNTDPLDMIKAGIIRFFHLASESKRRKLLFEDAPHVLGWHKWRNLDAKYGLGMLTAAISMAVQAKSIKTVDAQVTAQLLLSAIIESAMICSVDVTQKDQVQRTLLALVDSALTPA